MRLAGHVAYIREEEEEDEKKNNSYKVEVGKSDGNSCVGVG
jgi:hypothetical protein